MWTKLTFCKKMRRYVNQREAQTSLKTWPNPYPRTRRKGNFFFASSDILPIFWKCPSSIDSKGSLQCLYWRLSFCFIYKQVVLIFRWNCFVVIGELLRNSNLRPSQWKSAYIVRCPSTSYALCAYALSYETAIFPSATAIITFYSFCLWRTFFVVVYTLDIRLSPGSHSKESIPKEPLLMNLIVC